MGQFFETLPPSLVPWLLAQRMFYIASAPLSGSGHVNVSPKGISDKGGPFFGVIRETKSGERLPPLTNHDLSAMDDDEDGEESKEKAELKAKRREEDKNVVVKQFWYMDLTGSGIETTSHLHEVGNGRITVMFNALKGPARILRIFGKGTVHEFGTPSFHDLVTTQKINTIPGTRSIITVSIHQVGTSCGFSVPTYEFVGFRPTLNDFFEKRAESDRLGKRKDGIDIYWAHKNAKSMDGLDGFKRGVEIGGKEDVKPIKKMVGQYALEKGEVRRASSSARVFGVESLVIVAVGSSLLTALVLFLLLVAGGGSANIWSSGGKADGMRWLKFTSS